MRNDDSNLIWKIAAGIVIGLVAWNLLHTFAEYKRQEALAKEIERVFDPKEQERRAREWFPEIHQARETMHQQAVQRSELERRQQEASALQPGQRCIQKQRFQRVENGWEQVGSC